jgi:UDP-N-acetylglucosamine 1-carboxyvinyltransferase
MGENKIFGEINLSGAKNSALPIIIAACLSSEDVVLENVPIALNDVQVLISVLRDIGYIIEENGNSLYFKEPNKQLIKSVVNNEAAKIRYSLLLLPLLLSARGEISNPSPGGCNLGDRKYDIHLDLLQKMGAKIEDSNGRITGSLQGNFKGCELLFHTATTSGSESAIIAAAISEGRTIIKNANTRPEVIDLINFLNHLGAKIKYKTRYIEIEGVKRLFGGRYQVISDRHEGVSYIILAAMARGEIKINDFSTRFIREDIELLQKIGVDVFEWGNAVFVSAKNKQLNPFSMATSPYPGINSDMQPLFAALAATIRGESIITDTRFTDRFQYVEEFKKLGVDIVNYQNCAIIQGGNTLSGTDVYATDLRAGAALTLLGLVAQGTTRIQNFYQTERGYVDIINKITKVGGKIFRK